jgi:hypothetical protein
MALDGVQQFLQIKWFGDEIIGSPFSCDALCLLVGRSEILKEWSLHGECVR